MQQQDNGFKPRTYALIHEDHLLHNYRLLQQQAKGARLCCVVKADAYGHGTQTVVRALRCAGADFFAVSCVEEASAVRQALGERKTPILILGYTRPCHVPFLLRENITQTLLSAEYAKALRDAVPKGAKLSVHIALDTGMNRIGFVPENLAELLPLFDDEHFVVTGIFSHFYLSDEPQCDATEAQYVRFAACVDALQAQVGKIPLVHISNSAAISNFPQMRCDMVRAGISLYGLKPSAQTAIDGLLPVMTLKTILSHVHTVHAGETVGYGGTFRATHSMRIGTLPVGYADGYLRAYAGGYVLIRGKRAPLLGRICMDQCMVDLSDIPSADIGDEVELFGAGELTAETLAGWARTISYEVVCLLSKRVVRLSQKGSDLSSATIVKQQDPVAEHVDF